MKKETKVNKNQVTITGEVISKFTYDYEIFKEKFYKFDILVRRLSNEVDILPVVISERMIDVKSDFTGQYMKIEGQFRSYNRHDSGKKKLVLAIFVKEYEVLEELESGDINIIELNGFLCKEPVYRKTPLDREIGDILVAVNRTYGKSDYIPCIAWGRNARYVSNFEVGTFVSIIGRIQSREYIKKLPDDTSETRIAYEVSVSKIAIQNEEENENANESDSIS